MGPVQPPGSAAVADFVTPPADLLDLVAQGFLRFAAANNNASTVVSFDSDGSAGQAGATGTLVTLAGLHFTDSATSVTQLSDNIVTA